MIDKICYWFFSKIDQLSQKVDEVLTFKNCKKKKEIMAKQKFVHFVPRDKPPKLGPGRHKKNLNKSEKRKKRSPDIKVKADERSIKHFR